MPNDVCQLSSSFVQCEPPVRISLSQELVVRLHIKACMRTHRLPASPTLSQLGLQSCSAFPWQHLNYIIDSS